MNNENQNVEYKQSWGRGWKKICDGFQAAGLPKPTIESAQGGVLVTFQRNNVNLKTKDGGQIGVQTTETPKDVVERVVDKYADELSERQRVILKIVNQFVVEHVVEGVVEDGVEIPSASSLAKQLKTSSRTLQREFAYLREKGILRRVGGDFGGHWELIE